MVLNKEYINGLGEFEFYKGYFIGRINDGVNVGSNFVDALSELIHKHYHGKPFIYISDRINSYSLDPLATEDLIKRNNIRFVGVVVYTQQQEHMFYFEERFLDGITMRNFVSLDAAVVWSKQKLQEINKAKKVS